MDNAKDTVGKLLDLVDLNDGADEAMLTLVALGCTIGYGIAFPSWEKARERITERVRATLDAYEDLTAFDGLEGADRTEFIRETVNRIHHFVIG